MTDRAADEARKLGTFGGVFTPSLLTILGLVLFLRLGFVTGNVGLGQMLLVLVLATSVSILTTMSLAAIATNLRVGVGGIYFLVSRTLGPAFGGAIGLVLYLSIAVSVAFYAIGFGEAVAGIVDVEARLVAAGLVVGLLGLAWLGADIATRLQYAVMVLLAAAIVGYFVGVVPDLDPGLLSDNFGRPSDGDAFWVAFALFFPAITGFTQGVAMSGDLRTPSRSITVGTFGAIGVSTVVYLAVIITLAMAVPLAALQDDTSIMRELSVSPVVIDVGVIAATLSSAIASMLGAPRTLQRLARDRLIGPLRPFAVGAGADDNPRRAVLLTAVIALGTVAAGDLDVIAPIISMFFLASYGMINFATYTEARAANTSFRPTFRFFDWRLSLLGAAACLGAIVAIDPIAGVVAGLALFGLYRYLRASVDQARWTDSSRGVHLSQVRSHLLALGSDRHADREWRPFTVAFVPRDPRRRMQLINVAAWLDGGAGFTTAARIVAGRGPVARKHATRVELEFQRELAGAGLPVHGRVLLANDREAGVTAMLQAHGLGVLTPNIALFGWYDGARGDRMDGHDFPAMLQSAVRFGCHTAVLHANSRGWERAGSGRRPEPVIAVWWSDDRTGQLLTLLAWMCTRGPVWGDAVIEVRVRNVETDHVRRLVDDARIPARVVDADGAVGFVEAMADADLVFAPLRLRRGTALGPGDVGLHDLVQQLDLAVFAHAADQFELDIQPDEGGVAALADARDRAAETAGRATELDRAASALMVEAEMLRMDYEANGHTPDERLTEATAAATAAHRAYLDARSRADEALRLVRELDPADATDDLDTGLWVPAPTDTDER